MEVFDDLPVIGHTFYGEKTFSYKHELGRIGVVVDFVYAIEKFALIFKEKASNTSINTCYVLSHFLQTAGGDRI